MTLDKGPPQSIALVASRMSPFSRLICRLHVGRIQATETLESCEMRRVSEQPQVES